MTAAILTSIGRLRCVLGLHTYRCEWRNHDYCARCDRVKTAYR